MDGATKRVSEYIRHKGFNLSDISRKTHIPLRQMRKRSARESRQLAKNIRTSERTTGV